jgi:membrane-associated phospholipid phosphatase
MPQPSSIAIRHEWQVAWNVPGFRHRFVAGIILVVTILSIFPHFFHWVEQRQGIVLNDPLIAAIPPHNVSVPLFILIWALSTWTAIRAVQNPHIFLVFIWSFVVLSLFRTLTITLVPLEPPAGLIGLSDPLSNFFYGHDRFITKDLFFSGHTSTMFLLYFCLTGRGDKRAALFVTFSVAFLLLVQHVHYTLDILGGFLFGWLSWWLGSRVVNRTI